jgi:hypothetical protein
MAKFSITAKVFFAEKLFNTGDLDKIIENSLEETARAVKVDLNAITRSWKHRPGFSIERGPYWRMVHANKTTKAGEVFDMLDAGTRPHVIRARNVPRLRFYAKGFVAKTTPRVIFSEGGQKATHNFRTPVEVHHPGTKAREWYDVIQEKWNKEMPAQMQRSIDAAITRMMRVPPKVLP